VQVRKTSGGDQKKAFDLTKLPRIRVVTVSAPLPDPRAVTATHKPAGQGDVQDSLPGRQGDGRAWS
jgi:hypothetical protein